MIYPYGIRRDKYLFIAIYAKCILRRRVAPSRGHMLSNVTREHIARECTTHDAHSGCRYTGLRERHSGGKGRERRSFDAVAGRIYAGRVRVTSWSVPQAEKQRRDGRRQDGVEKMTECNGGVIRRGKASRGTLDLFLQLGCQWRRNPCCGPSA